MNHKHSFLTRGLAMLLALVLVLSNASLGLTMSLQAAENGNLFDLIAASKTCGNKDMNKVLAYADALYNLNDETVSYESEPTAADARLLHGELTVNAVGNWVPFTYTVAGVKNQFTGTTVNVGDVESVSVTYKLDLNKDASVKAAMELIAALAKEAKAQKDALDAISGTTAMIALGMLDYRFTKKMINAVNELTMEDVGVEAPELPDDLNNDGKVDYIDEMMRPAAEEAYEKELAAKLEATKAEYKAIIAGLQDRMVAEGTPYYDIVEDDESLYEDYLLVYAMLSEYKNKKTGGLSNFYQNADVIVPELEKLSVALFNILGEANEDGTYANDSVVNALLVEMGYATDVDAADLATMAGRMEHAAETLNKLVAYKTEIDLTSEQLKDLCDALSACQNYDYNTSLYLESKGMNVLDDSSRWINVSLAGLDVAPVPSKLPTDVVLTEAMIADIIADVEAGAPYYNVDTAPIKALIGKTLRDNIYITCDAEPKEFKVNIYAADGETVLETITVYGNEEEINLTVKAGHATEYVVDGELYALEGVDFDADRFLTVDVDMAKVANGTFIIKVEADRNDAEDKLNTLIADLNKQIGPNAFVLSEDELTLTANITLNDLVTFADVLYRVFLTDYGTVYMGGTDLIGYNDKGEARYNIQALVDALLNDDTFTSEKMIALGEGKTNNLLNTTIKFPGYEEMAFVMNLTQVPSQMATVAKGLKAVDNYFTFESNNGQLDVTLTIPEKVYEAYLTAAVATWKLDADNAADLTNEMAFNFIVDYIHESVNNEVTTTTLTNTLATVGVQKDLTAAEGYFQLLKKVIAGSDFNCVKDNVYDITMNTSGKDIITLTELLGLDGTGMLIANKPINATTKITITNDEVPDFQALVVEPGKVKANGVKNKMNTIDFTTDLANADITGSAAVMLLSDVTGPLNFPGHLVLDLNGNTITGDLNVAGKLVIIDSALDTYEGGAIKGNVSAKGGAILGGTYTDDVTSFLRDGYTQDNGSVRNNVFYIDAENGVYNYVLNADFYQQCEGYLPSIEAIAVEIATDLVINGYYAYTSVGLSYNGQSLYSLNIDNILDTYTTKDVDALIDAVANDAIQSINAEGITALANDIIDDLCGFEHIAAVLGTDEPIATYNFSTSPLMVDFIHNKTADIIDVSLIANPNVTKNFAFALTVKGENKYIEYAKELMAAMAEIVSVDANVALNQPVYNGDLNDLLVSGNADLSLEINTTANGDYNKAIAIILAYGNPEYREAVNAAGDCVLELNKIIASATVTDIVDALVRMNQNASIIDMANAIGYPYETVESVENLEKVYHVFLCGIGKALEIFAPVESEKADLVIDLVQDREFVEVLSIVVAYAYPEYKQVLRDAKDYAAEMKKIASGMSAKEILNALKTAQGRKAMLSDMAEEINYIKAYAIDAAKLVEMEKIYNMIQAAGSKGLAFVNVNNNDNQLDAYQTVDATFAYGRTASADVTVGFRSYNGVFAVEASTLSITVKMAPKCTGLLGDADRNGRVNTMDSALIRQYYVGMDVNPHLCVSDVNGDGKYNTMDSALIRQYYVGKITEFPVETR